MKLLNCTLVCLHSNTCTTALQKAGLRAGSLPQGPEENLQPTGSYYAAWNPAIYSGLVARMGTCKVFEEVAGEPSLTSSYVCVAVILGALKYSIASGLRVGLPCEQLQERV